MLTGVFRAFVFKGSRTGSDSISMQRFLMCRRKNASHESMAGWPLRHTSAHYLPPKRLLTMVERIVWCDDGDRETQDVALFRQSKLRGLPYGPALNSMTFHALGMQELSGAGTYGDFSDDETTRLGRGGFTQREEDMYAFKTPQLYNLTDSPFYGHGAEFHSLREVAVYKNRAVPSNPEVPASRLAPAFQPLGLTDQKIDALVAFLSNALYDPNLMRYVPAALPSGNCFPVNDAQARADLGC